MTSSRPATVLASALCLALAAPGARAEVYGLKSRAGAPTGSIAPTRLFRFAESGLDFTDIGPVRLAGSDIDADALALSPRHGLRGFRLQPAGSTLLSIDPTSGVALAIGPLLAGREIRGAAFDAADNLLALDAAGNALLRIDPVTGLVLSSTPVMSGGSPFDVSNVTDLSVRGDGQAFLVHSAGLLAAYLYALDLSTGEATLELSDPAPGDPLGSAIAAFPGAAFSQLAPRDRLFLYEVNGRDDVWQYDDLAAGPLRSMLYPDLLPSFNSGRGDLAATAVLPPRLSCESGVNPHGRNHPGQGDQDGFFQVCCLRPVEPGAPGSLRACGLEIDVDARGCVTLKVTQANGNAPELKKMGASNTSAVAFHLTCPQDPDLVCTDGVTGIEVRADSCRVPPSLK